VLLDWLLSDEDGTTRHDQVPLGHWMRHCCRECGRHLNIVTGSAAAVLATLVLLPALAWLV
jgi:hypothetical protein